MIITVLKSPYKEDKNMPWSYHSRGFRNWVFEVLLNCGKAGKYPTIKSAVEIAQNAGYEVEIK